MRGFANEQKLRTVIVYAQREIKNDGNLKKLCTDYECIVYAQQKL